MLKNKKNTYFYFLICWLAFANQSIAQTPKTYSYEAAANDPLNTRIYKLKNGLTVYLSVYKNAPRIQTYIAVRAGSKNDPADATGLAHYLEHMLFKGTDVYGTKDPAKELIYIKQIEELYETYRKTTDENKRKILYHQIDSISGIASTYAIANEYDKMLSSIGAKGTNAYTYVEQTVYVNDIPSNQVQKWLTIEAERFRKPILRLFHTELEAVYEEKNRNLDNDNSKIWEATMAGLFQKHTYGTQTTIGTIDHLKNPSLKKIREYYDKYYIPNNMAICMSGDFNPDSVITWIDNKFGKFSSKPISKFIPAIEAPITKPIVKDIFGPTSESTRIAYRFAGAGSSEADMITLISQLLSNGKAGLFDLNLQQQQKVLNAFAFPMVLKDYSALCLGANPKEAQKLEDLTKLLLAEIEKLKNGAFDEWLMKAVINDLKLQQIKNYEENRARADAMVEAFIMGQDWKFYNDQIIRLSKITKQQVVDFAKKHFANNYVVVYKRIGEDKTVKKVVKPAITPVEINRNDQSDFVKNIINTPAPPIEPVFIDYKKDIQTFSVKENAVQVTYNQNTENKTFDLYYVLDMGNNNDRRLNTAIRYLKLLGTSTMSAEQVNSEFYKLACSFDVFSGEDQTYISLNGLSENFEPALKLFETVLNDAQVNEEKLHSLIGDILKEREDGKKNKGIIRRGMINYGTYGPESPMTYVLSPTELNSLKPQELVDIIRQLNSYEHHISYYGSHSTADLAQYLNKYHTTPTKLLPLPPEKTFEQIATGGKVYVVDYDMKQAEITLLLKSDRYDKTAIPTINVFNDYFGGGMSSIVFQEIRESKALAYSANSFYTTPNRPDRAHYVSAYIGTQADKLPEALNAMFNLYNNMPASPVAFASAKESVIQNIRTQRINRAAILFNYDAAKRMGLDYDIRKNIFVEAQKMSIDDIKRFEESKFKDKSYTLLVLGKKDLLDLKTLEKYGTVTFLKLEDIFGY